MSIVEELRVLGLENLGDLSHGLTTAQLIEQIVANREGRLAHRGALIVRTGHTAQRMPRDRWVVARPEQEQRRWLSGMVRPLSEEAFEALFGRVATYLHNRDLTVQDCVAGAGDHQIGLRFVTELAWHGLLARTLYRPSTGDNEGSSVDFTILHVPRFQAIPEHDQTASSTFTIFDPGRKLVLIGGTAYGEEIRQAVTTISRWNAVDGDALPLQGAVNTGETGDVAVFLGRTGNGKTALAAHPSRTLVGDHEILWSAQGVVALERGCSARTADLTSESNPTIWSCTKKFGTILENVALDQRTRRPNFADHRVTTNARALFPGSHLPRFEMSGLAGHPKHLFLLTRDTLGVLPPIARLDADQAAFAFLTSYVSSLEETEAHLGDVRPSAQGAFGGLPASAWRPEEYTKKFMEQIIRQGTTCWFMNTGFVGEPMGRGERFDLEVSRVLVHAALRGALDNVEYEKDPLFQFQVPKSCPGVDAALLDPRSQAADQGEYEMRANRLALDFIEGFKRFEINLPDSMSELVASVPILDTDLDLLEQVGFSI